jgi:hypothetical protein
MQKVMQISQRPFLTETFMKRIPPFPSRKRGLASEANPAIGRCRKIKFIGVKMDKPRVLAWIAMVCN